MSERIRTSVFVALRARSWLTQPQANHIVTVQSDSEVMNVKHSVMTGDLKGRDTGVIEASKETSHRCHRQLAVSQPLQRSICVVIWPSPPGCPNMTRRKATQGAHVYYLNPFEIGRQRDADSPSMKPPKDRSQTIPRVDQAAQASNSPLTSPYGKFDKLSATSNVFCQQLPWTR